MDMRFVGCGFPSGSDTYGMSGVSSTAWLRVFTVGQQEGVIRMG